jgi:hypothetical protein
MQVLSQQFSPGETSFARCLRWFFEKYAPTPDEKRDSEVLARRNFPRPAKNVTQYPVLQKN